MKGTIHVFRWSPPPGRLADAAEEDEGRDMLKAQANIPRLDIGGGNVKHGWTTIDLNTTADVTHNLNKCPWPFRNNTFSYLRMSHVLEHLDDPLKAMKECFRIAKPGAILEVRVPWWKDDMFSWPVHRWHFKPIWFHRLKLRPDMGGPGNPLSFTEIEGMEWHVIKEHILRGSRRFWKKYQYTVWLEAVK